jgi:hypothetical protein
LLAFGVVLISFIMTAMMDTNPPQELGPNNSVPDRERDVRRLAELFRIAEHEFAVQERRQAFVRELVTQDDFDDLNFPGAALICCTRGGTTREMPCRNSQWWGCPFYDNDRERERSRGYNR